VSSNVTIGIVGLYTPAHKLATTARDRGHEIVGTDVDGDLRATFRDAFDEARVVDSVEELLARPIDGVFVATPTRFHAEPAIAALRAGYPTMIRKPLAHDRETARRIADVAAETGTGCYLSFKTRCTDAFQELGDRIAAGELGTVYHVDAVRSRTCGIPAVGSWMTSRELSGGGALFDLGTTLVDSGRFLLGAPDHERVLGVLRQRFDAAEHELEGTYTMDRGSRERINVEDSASVLIEYEGGLSQSVEVHWASNLPQRHRYWIYGDEKGAYVDFPNGQYAIYRYDRDEPEPIDTGEDSWWIHTREARLDAFVAAIDGSDTPLASVEAGLAGHEAVCDVYERARSYQ
jgi:predicted dehydrogenase